MRKRNRKIMLGLGLAASISALRRLRRHRFDLVDKTVFITGGSRGLGLVLARDFAARGAKVAIAARDQEALDRATADVRTHGRQVLAIETDITMREEADAALDQIRQHFGPVDILVNNAGTICVGPLEVMTIVRDGRIQTLDSPHSLPVPNNLARPRRSLPGVGYDHIELLLEPPTLTDIAKDALKSDRFALVENEPRVRFEWKMRAFMRNYFNFIGSRVLDRAWSFPVSRQ